MISADTFIPQVPNESDDEYNFDIDNDFQSVVGGGATVYSPSIATFRNTFRDDTMQSRMGRTTAGETLRPMTAIAGAGFQSQSNPNSQIGRFGSGGESSKSHQQEEATKTPQEIVRQLVKDVNQCIEESSILLLEGELFHALQKAEAAVKKDRILSKHREKYSLSIQQGQNLTYATWFNLAKVYERNQKYDKALETYDTLVRQKRFKDRIGRIRINMGNLYHIQEKFPIAIRMYRMALDQTSREEKDTRLKILRNIGNTFVKIGKLRDAIIAYEDAVGTSYDMKSCINLISCYVQLGDEEKSRQTLFRMISAAQKILGSTEEVEIEANVGRLEKESRDDLDKKRKETESILHTAARMVAKLSNESNWVDSFLWVHEQLHEKFPHVAFQIEIERAIEHLQKGEFAAAVKIFKSYENKDIEFKANVATNLSFVYFLEGNYITADEYADIALLSNKYNPNALVNKGNCLFIHEDYTRAREFYLEAIAIKSTCFEAIYNLALTNIRLGKTSEAMQSFVKLHTVSSNDPRVLYQVANLYEELDESSKAAKWFNVLSATVPTDPGVLSRLGQLLLHTNDENQSFHYHLESYRCYPSNIDVIGWLAVWFVKHEMFEKSIHFFRRASQIQPKEIKWKIMVASCHRKMGRDYKALTFYQKILKDNPENAECLQHLISVCKELGRPYSKYESELEMIQSGNRTSPDKSSSKQYITSSTSNTRSYETMKSNSDKFLEMGSLSDEDDEDMDYMDDTDNDVNNLLA